MKSIGRNDFPMSSIVSNMLNCVFCKLIRRQVVWMLSCSDSAVALRRPLTGWWWNRKGRMVKQSRISSFLSFFLIFFFKGELSITAIVSSIWNMQIADSAFACWCLTFPLEVAHRLNYAPYLQSVWKHLLSSHTPPPSAKPTSAHLILGVSV